MSVCKKTIISLFFLMMSGCCVFQKNTVIDSSSCQLLDIKKMKSMPYAIPLGCYHNKVGSVNPCFICDSNQTEREQIFDSNSYKAILLKHSTYNASNTDCLLIKGNMCVDSICEGVNVIKIIVICNSQKYYIYSLPNKKQYLKKKRIKEGECYYLEILPYFFPDEDNYNNAGLYIDGFVLRDQSLPLQKWKNVCTTKWIAGDDYNPIKNVETNNK